jgi:hypothetical protein
VVDRPLELAGRRVRSTFCELPRRESAVLECKMHNRFALGLSVERPQRPKRRRAGLPAELLAFAVVEASATPMASAASTVSLEPLTLA